MNQQQVVVLGAGRSGVAAARLAQKHGAEVTLLDSAPAERFGPVMESLPEVSCSFGESAEAYKGDADLAIVSPGIDRSAPLVRQFLERGIAVIGEIEFAYRFWQGGIVGITGTNGKTTTTELASHLLNACASPALPAGNYGMPFAEVVLQQPETETATSTIVVLELSSFQLESIVDFRPDVSVWLNFAPDHMDRYVAVEDYLNAKRAIFRNQTASDWSVVNALNGPEISLAPRTLTFSAFAENADFTFQAGDILFRGHRVASLETTLLSGKHNAENLMAAMAVGHARGIPFERLEAGACSYQPPRHRCEVVAKHKGITFINDSKATNVHALQSSLKAYDGEIILIAGGKDKGLDYTPLVPLLSRSVLGLIAIGEIRHQLCRMANDSTKCMAAESLEEAVALACSRAREGQTVLFSPGTSSFDMFDGFEQRGDAFCTLVHRHLQNHE